MVYYQLNYICNKFAGVESVSIDMKEKKLTLSGDIDPVNAVSKLRKVCHIEVVSVGTSKPKEEKKSEDKPFEGYPFYYHVQQPQYIQDYYYI
jgi:hypothetical protein